jgi:predicted  nucleic acid-binding Zn-ribbon protein
VYCQAAHQLAAALAAAEGLKVNDSCKQLQQQGVKLQSLLDESQAAATSAQLCQQQLQQHLQAIEQELHQLRVAHADAMTHEKQLQEQIELLQQEVAHTKIKYQTERDQLKMSQSELAQLQQQLQSLNSDQETCKIRLEQVQAEKMQLELQQRQLQDSLAAAQLELVNTAAAAKAAAEAKAARPQVSTQVSAANHADLQWVKAKAVQTGEELDPKSTKDVGTPADLALLSYFFREIKQKQRGGGGAILGYDPAAAVAAAAGPAVTAASAKSWSGGTTLPPIHHHEEPREPVESSGLPGKRAATAAGGIRTWPGKGGPPARRPAPGPEYVLRVSVVLAVPAVHTDYCWKPCLPCHICSHGVRFAQMLILRQIFKRLVCFSHFMQCSISM